MRSSRSPLLSGLAVVMAISLGCASDEMSACDPLKSGSASVAEHVEVEDGGVLVLICEDSDEYCPDAGKLFYGSPDDLRQGQIVGVGGSCAGEGINFELDGIEHRLWLTEDTGTLEIDGTTLAVTAVDSQDVSGYSFRCDPDVTVPEWVPRGGC